MEQNLYKKINYKEKIFSFLKKNKIKVFIFIAFNFESYFYNF